MFKYVLIISGMVEIVGRKRKNILSVCKMFVLLQTQFGKK